MPLLIVRQDITKINVDAVVNTTNTKMKGFSGVDFAVHSAAGKELDKYCETLPVLKNGAALVTDGYKLPCKYIIHTCGPVWNGEKAGTTQVLKDCYKICLEKATELNCETVAFPLISSGANGYPKNTVLSVAVNAITEFLSEHEITVYLCVYDKTSFELSKKLFSEIKSYIDDNYTEENSYCNINFDRSASLDDFCGNENSRPTVCFESCFEECAQAPAKKFAVPDINKFITNMDKSFAETLFSLIDKKGMTDVECYKKANVSRKTFSKIKCDENYRPSKETAVAFAIALELNIDETNSFLRTAGIALSNSYKFDVIIQYFILNGNYDIFEINEALFEFDQPCLGC